MLKFLFSPEGRIGRSGFWLGSLCHIVGVLLATGVCLFLAQIIPGSGGPGEYNVDGMRAVPLIIVVFGAIGFGIWSHVCIGIKRFHDRDKDGAWVLIQFVPVIGGIWYLVEAGFLRGTEGPNRFGPDPRGRSVMTANEPNGGGAL